MKATGNQQQIQLAELSAEQLETWLALLVEAKKALQPNKEESVKSDTEIGIRNIEIVLRNLTILSYQLPTTQLQPLLESLVETFKILNKDLKEEYKERVYNIYLKFLDIFDNQKFIAGIKELLVVFEAFGDEATENIKIQCYQSGRDYAGKLNIDLFSQQIGLIIKIGSIYLEKETFVEAMHHFAYAGHLMLKHKLQDPWKQTLMRCYALTEAAYFYTQLQGFPDSGFISEACNKNQNPESILRIAENIKRMGRLFEHFAQKEKAIKCFDFVLNIIAEYKNVVGRGATKLAQEVTQLIKSVQINGCDTKSSLDTFSQLVEIYEGYLDKLKNIRKSSEEKTADKDNNVHEYLVTPLHSLVESIISDCIKVVGPFPCEFAFLNLTHVSGPFSSFKVVCLTSNSKRVSESYVTDYLKQLFQLIEIRVIGLIESGRIRETPAISGFRLSLSRIEAEKFDVLTKEDILRESVFSLRRAVFIFGSNNGIALFNSCRKAISTIVSRDNVLQRCLGEDILKKLLSQYKTSLGTSQIPTVVDLKVLYNLLITSVEVVSTYYNISTSEDEEAEIKHQSNARRIAYNKVTERAQVKYRIIELYQARNITSTVAYSLIVILEFITKLMREAQLYYKHDGTRVCLKGSLKNDETYQLDETAWKPLTDVYNALWQLNTSLIEFKESIDYVAQSRVPLLVGTPTFKWPKLHKYCEALADYYARLSLMLCEEKIFELAGIYISFALGIVPENREYRFLKEEIDALIAEEIQVERFISESIAVAVDKYHRRLSVMRENQDLENNIEIHTNDVKEELSVNEVIESLKKPFPIQLANIEIISAMNVFITKLNGLEPKEVVKLAKELFILLYRDFYRQPFLEGIKLWLFTPLKEEVLDVLADYPRLDGLRPLIERGKQLLYEKLAGIAEIKAPESTITEPIEDGRNGRQKEKLENSPQPVLSLVTDIPYLQAGVLATEAISSNGLHFNSEAKLKNSAYEDKLTAKDKNHSDIPFHFQLAGLSFDTQPDLLATHALSRLAERIVGIGVTRNSIFTQIYFRGKRTHALVYESIPELQRIKRGLKNIEGKEFTKLFIASLLIDLSNDVDIRDLYCHDFMYQPMNHDVIFELQKIMPDRAILSWLEEFNSYGLGNSVEKNKVTLLFERLILLQYLVKSRPKISHLETLYEICPKVWELFCEVKFIEMRSKQRRESILIEAPTVAILTPAHLNLDSSNLIDDKLAPRSKQTIFEEVLIDKEVESQASIEIKERVSLHKSVAIAMRDLKKKNNNSLVLNIDKRRNLLSEVNVFIRSTAKTNLDYLDWQQGLDFSNLNDEEQNFVLREVLNLLNLKVERLIFRKCSALNTSKLKEILSKVPNLQLLDISDCENITDDAIRIIPDYCKGLEVLKINSLPRLTQFVGLKGMPIILDSLKELSAANNSELKVINIASSKLTYLDLRNCTKLTFAELCSMMRTTLKWIQVDGCAVSNDEKKSLYNIVSQVEEHLGEKIAEAIDGLRKLENKLFRSLANKGKLFVERTINSIEFGKLELNQQQFILDELYFVISNNCIPISTLKLDGCKALTEKWLYSILQYAPMLTQLNVSETSLSNDSLKTIVQFSRLQVLNISSLPGLSAIQGRWSSTTLIFPCLETLLASGNLFLESINISGPELTFIDLSHCPKITYKALQHILSPSSTPKLEDIDLNDCSSITEEHNREIKYSLQLPQDMQKNDLQEMVIYIGGELQKGRAEPLKQLRSLKHKEKVINGIGNLHYPGVNLAQVEPRNQKIVRDAISEVRLPTLNLSGCMFLDYTWLKTFCLEQTQLTKLDVSCSSVGNYEFSYFPWLLNLTELKAENLSSRLASIAPGILSFGSALQFTSLQILNLNNNKELRSVSMYMPNLREASLQGVSISSNALMDILTPLVDKVRTPINRLHFLDLSGCQELGNELKDFLEITKYIAKASNLAYLSFRGCNLGNKCVVNLCTALTVNKSIVELDLSSNSLGDDAILGVSVMLQGNSTLKHIDVSENGAVTMGTQVITSSAARDFFNALKMNKTVKSLNLMNCLEIEINEMLVVLKLSTALTQVRFNVENAEISSELEVNRAIQGKFKREVTNPNQLLQSARNKCLRLINIEKLTEKLEKLRIEVAGGVMTLFIFVPLPSEINQEDKEVKRASMSGGEDLVRNILNLFPYDILKILDLFDNKEKIKHLFDMCEELYIQLKSQMAKIIDQIYENEKIPKDKKLEEVMNEYATKKQRYLHKEIVERTEFMSASLDRQHILVKIVDVVQGWLEEAIKGKFTESLLIKPDETQHSSSLI